MTRNIVTTLCTAGFLGAILSGPALAQSTTADPAGTTGMGLTVPHTAGKMGPGTTGLSSNAAGMHRTGMGMEPPGLSGTGTSGAGVSTSTAAPSSETLPGIGTGAHNPATARPSATTGGVPR